ncbi:hypothetical protein [Metabacillus halosaccharovorans]|uniref:DUF4912 domain-containing protein n=1 Tax=Metabacillus halosaccharovorans TaxID=930124 RepID=A0ABT3DD28_9BACI|nr:hypothetical protein [Metabacillus halosaccharovorans]MCV9884852.1 hypothetical protein [Metabacillus halosaccharovorans]
MSSRSYDNVEQYIVRKQASISVDYIEIIPYPNHIIISWNIISSTQNLLTDILNEDFRDLICKVNLVRVKKNNERLTMNVTGSNGIIEFSSLVKGKYYCELVVVNSQNETITIKKSSLVSISNNHIQSKNQDWKQVLTKNNNSWYTAFSGYTVYE